MGYRQMIDQFALGQLIKPPDIPDYHLMVGSAESLESMPLMVYTNETIPNVVLAGWQEIKDLEPSNIEQAINENQLEVNDMNWNVAMIGGGLGVGGI